MLQTHTKKSYSGKTLGNSSSNPIAVVVHYIRKNLDKPLSVGELSQKAYMSESNFHRVFKNELGVSPIEFINEERMRKATKLLQNTRKKIKEVCIECGFNSLSYFTRCFKKKHHVSPNEYRKRVQLY